MPVAPEAPVAPPEPGSAFPTLPQAEPSTATAAIATPIRPTRMVAPSVVGSGPRAWAVESGLDAAPGPMVPLPVVGPAAPTGQVALRWARCAPCARPHP